MSISFYDILIIMAPRTSNLYGKIIISKRAIGHVVVAAASECYGVAEVGKHQLTKSGMKKTKYGVSVSCENNNIEVSVPLYLKFGVTIDPVIESIRRAVKYNVENFTGMTVDCVNIDILGIKN